MNIDEAVHSRPSVAAYTQEQLKEILSRPLSEMNLVYDTLDAKDGVFDPAAIMALSDTDLVAFLFVHYFRMQIRKGIASLFCMFIDDEDLVPSILTMFLESWKENI